MKKYKSIIEIGESARKASKLLAIASSEQKNLALLKMSEHIGLSANKILEENKKDLKQAEEKNISPAFLDRLMLNKDRLDDIRKSLEEIASFEDPVGKIQSSWERPNGLKISRVSTPLGVIGVIFESRPNVTADAGALCLKSGNASILRGGSDSIHSSLAIGECLEKGLYDAKLPASAIQVINSTDREIVKHMLNGMNKNIGNISFYDSKQSDYNFTKPYSDSTAEKIDSEVKRIVDSAYERTKKLLLDKRDQLEKIANKLLEKEILFQNDLETLIGKRPFENKQIVQEENKDEVNKPNDDNSSAKEEK